MVKENDRSIVDVVQDILANIQNLIRAEIRLAKAELTEEGAKSARAAGLIAGGAVVALFAIGLLLLTVLFALGTVMPLWAAALILLAVTTSLSIGLLIAGKKRFRAVHTTPQKTIETVKENVRWVKSQTK